MPQLIAMVIVVVGAMIYMFQTFGGTGDKIEGIAQKTSVITEINNIKNGVRLAALARQIAVAGGTTISGDNIDGAVATLDGLGTLEYFQGQINDQLTDAVTPNVYNAISFGGTELTGAVNTSAVQISLVTNAAGVIPGIFVNISGGGKLRDNAGFLEMQIANDLGDIALIDRNATVAAPAAVAQAPVDGVIPPDPVIPANVAANERDGQFIVYFRDFGAPEVVLP
jgi:hypothetical protein